MAKLKIGFIGCGGIANAKHFPGMAQQKEYVDMVAFCDLIPERAEKAAKEYGTPDAKVYTDYHDLLADPTIDAVHVLTPNVAHCEITVAALEAGKHVLCEKPMAATPADAQKMLDARDRTGKMLTIGYQYRHFPVNQVAKKVVDDGWLGDIYYAEATYLRRRGVPTWGVFTDKSKQGGGPLIDIGTHALDLTLFMMNNYEPAYCVGKTFHKLNKQKNTGNAWGDWDTEKFTAEDSAFGFVVMKNGALINLKSSWALNMADPIEAVTTICGDKAGADMLKGLRINTVIGGRQVMITPDLSAGSVAFFDGAAGGAPEDLEAKTFTDAVLGKGKLYVTADQAAVVTRILEGIYESDRTGKPVYFD